MTSVMALEEGSLRRGRAQGVPLTQEWAHCVCTAVQGTDTVGDWMCEGWCNAVWVKRRCVKKVRAERETYSSKVPKVFKVTATWS